MDIHSFSALFNTPARREAFLSLVNDNKKKNIFVPGLEGSAPALLFSNLLNHKQAHIVIANDPDEAGYLYNDLVQLNGSDTQYEATVVGMDTASDIAVIKIEATGLTPAVIGDSDKLAVGETTVAVGNPLGTLGGTVTNGIIILVFAFLVSPLGLPMLAAWTIGQMQRFRYFVQDAIYG